VLESIKKTASFPIATFVVLDIAGVIVLLMLLLVDVVAWTWRVG
jgi:hypothetical protein